MTMVIVIDVQIIVIPGEAREPCTPYLSLPRKREPNFLSI